MMHIAFLTPEFPHPKIINAAGIGTSIKNLANALIKKGCAVTIFIYGQNHSEIIIENGIEIHIIQDKNYLFGKWFLYRKYIQNYINKVIKKNKIDIIEAPDWTGFTAFMKFNIPLVIRFHGSDTYFCYLENRKQKQKNYWFEKIAISNANAFISPTKFAGDETKKLFKIKNKSIITIPNGIETQEFYNPEPEKFDKDLIVYFGTIIRKKGVLEVPNIFKLVLHKNPNAKLLLIGSDSNDIKTNNKSTWKLFKEQLDENVLENVKYLGKIPYNEVKSYIQKSNVCIFPSFAETQGMVTIEAMSMGKAVVNSNIGWSNELIIDGESGFLVHPNDHQGFANKINELLLNYDLSKKIGENARKRVEIIFDIDLLAQKNIDFYVKVIA